MDRYKLSCILALSAFLSACASEFATDPDRPHPMYAVQSPNTTGSGIGEVMGEPLDVVPLVTVDMPRTKNDPYVVHTITDRLTHPLAATTQELTPATRPGQTQAAPAAAPSGNAIKTVDQQHPGDAFRVTLDHEGNADLWVYCPTGIGFVVIERTNDTWPAVIHLHLRYDTDRAFTRLEGLSAGEVTAAGEPLKLKTAVDKNTATADVAIPGFAHSQRIKIEWVDVYR